jgi:hypothetical protein
MATPAVRQRPGVDNGHNGHIANDGQAGRADGNHIVCNDIGLVETDDRIAPGIGQKHWLNRRAATSNKVIVVAGHIGP